MMSKMEVFTKKVGGKYCPHFRFGNQMFRLSGYNTKEDAELVEQQLNVCFSNYGLLISRNAQKKLVDDSINKLKEIAGL